MYEKNLPLHLNLHVFEYIMTFLNQLYDRPNPPDFVNAQQVRNRIILHQMWQHYKKSLIIFDEKS